MEEKLNKVSELIDNANNIPEDIKPIVKAICRGYMRESNGSIPIEGIMNVCNTTFIKIDENDTEFSGENKIYGNTDVDYDKDGKVIHKMSYIHASNYIKLITILTHELGHVITEADQRPADEKGVYNFVKRTTDFYFTLFHNENNALMANEIHGFKLTDGFLESICTRIFASPEFRQELLESNYDLQDFVYKDERLFSSRVYDEYKACFELFDYVMDGALSRFSVSTSLPEIVDIINKYHLRVIFPYIDKSNDALNG